MRRIVFGLICWMAVSAGAQAQPTVPGLPWVGCWESAGTVAAEGVTCVVPEAVGSLRIIAVAGSGARTETVLRLDGAKVPLVAEGCSGWQRARLTPDGERILLDGESTCERMPRVQTAGAFVIMEGGDWVEAQGGGVATIVTSQLRRYRPVTNTLTIPADLRALVGPYLAEAEQVRYQVQGVEVSAADLLEMERMGVPPAVLDFVVAASYPRDFTIGGAVGGAAVAEARQDGDASARRVPMYIGGGPAMSYFDWAYLNGCRGAWGMMDPIGCGWYPMLNGGGIYFSPYARFGAAWPYGGWYGNPYGGGIVIRPITGPGDGVGNGGGGSVGGGRMVRGRGYVRDDGDGGSSAPRSAQPRSGSVRTESGSGSMGAGSGGSAGSGGGGGGSSAPRTAKPRDP